MHSLIRIISLFFLFQSCHSQESPLHPTFIQQQAQQWINNYLSEFNQKEHKELLIDIILLSYQIAQESCIMMTSKLIAQQELIQLHTPSLTDNWHTNLQAIKNDTTNLLIAINTFNQAQSNVERIIEAFKKIGPKIIHINPLPTQTLINDLKQALLVWGKEQQDLSEDLYLLEKELVFASTAISDAKQMFHLLEETKEFKHAHLKQAAGYISKTNKDLESLFTHITQMRQTNIIKIQLFFICFFKTYYALVYQHLCQDDQDSLHTTALGYQIIPHPDAFFTHSL